MKSWFSSRARQTAKAVSAPSAMTKQKKQFPLSPQLTASGEPKESIRPLNGRGRAQHPGRPWEPRVYKVARRKEATAEGCSRSLQQGDSQ